ncbi:MAG TPA: Wzz/FepE/Etk N-terminal domain-containing protein [Daejeonella sp.]|uniref:Wzz/FepE/Etk N-terminal domain-containing protein n=1 Tax=Daejeonella sp. TaxID=2805397 RepID=UPI002ED91E59
MEELKKFIQLLWRNRIIIIAIPLITVMITFYIVRNLPDTYSAPTQIATGIVDETQQMAFSDASLLQESRVNQKFVNLIETMRSKSLIDQVSYQLILHDLTSDKPFKDKTILYTNGLNEDAIAHAIEVYTEKYKNREALNLRDPDQAGLAVVMGWMGYDSGTILDGLSTYRLGASDFIHLDFESQNAELSAFVVNAIAREFIKDYTGLVKENQKASVDFLRNLMKIKSDTLEMRISQLAEYKIENRILDLSSQSLQVLNEISTYKNQQQETEKTMASLSGAIENIDKKFNPQDRKYAESVLVGANQDVLATRQEMQNLVDKYINNDFDEKYKKSIDSLQQIMTSKISNVNDKYIINPLNTKQNLIQQKLDLQLQYDLASFSLNSIKKHLQEISGKFNELVPHEAMITSMERDIDVVTKEYQELLAQYNQISMESAFPVKLRQVQIAMPGAPNPSKKMLLVILSGIVSGAFCIMIFFAIFFFDNRIQDPYALALSTKSPVLGYLNLVGRSTMDLKGIWNNIHGTSEIKEFKKQLRSTRFEVNKELAPTSGKGQILGITSINEGEGKTLISACIAYTYVMVNKKVLLIDGNFDTPSITKNSKTKIFFEDFLSTGALDSLKFNSGIMVMGNRGGDKSLLEMANEETILERLDQLRSCFDIILIESPSLSSLNKAKEWILFTDKTLGVFEANQTLDLAKKQHIDYLASLNGHFIGWILNKVTTKGKATTNVETANVIE